MKKMKSFFRSPMGTLFTFMLAVVLLMTGTIGGVRAAPQIFNREFYYGGLELDEIGVTLRENGDDVSSRDYNKTTQRFDTGSNNPEDSTEGILLSKMLNGEELKIGKTYTERLSVYNSGVIPTYVRVSVYKYWVDKDGNRFDAFDKEGKELLNKMIDLHFLQNEDWVIDQAPGANLDPYYSNSDSLTPERTVLYYTKVLRAGSPTSAFTDTLTIDKNIVDYAKINTTKDGNTVTWVADGMKFQIEVEVNAVQDHNARAAVKSAWGLTDADIARLGLKLS